MVVHEETLKYIALMKRRRFWFGTDDRRNTIFDRLEQFYLVAKIPLNFLALIVGFVFAYLFTKDMGISDGSLIHTQTNILVVAVNVCFYVNRKEHEKLISTLDNKFVKYNEPWMVEIRDGYTKGMWRNVAFIENYFIFTTWWYCILPPLLSPVLHYGFGLLDAPLYFPAFMTTYFEPKPSWDSTYYIVQLLNYWNIQEAIHSLIASFGGYSLLTAYCISDLVIFQKILKSSNFELSKKENDEQFRLIVDWHNDVIRLNGELRDFLGLPCAFQTVFWSFTLTLTVFTAYTSEDLLIRIIFGAGSSLYFAAAYIHCSLGQQMQDKGEEVFDEIYDLPWYHYNPGVRRNLIMMTRQSLEPLSIEYHGACRMNYEQLAQVLRAAYSYFTLLLNVLSQKDKSLD